MLVLNIWSPVYRIGAIGVRIEIISYIRKLVCAHHMNFDSMTAAMLMKPKHSLG